MRKEETDCSGKHTDKFNAAEINTDIYFKAFACIILEFNLKVYSWPSGRILWKFKFKPRRKPLPAAIDLTQQ